MSFWMKVILWLSPFSKVYLNLSYISPSLLRLPYFQIVNWVIFLITPFFKIYTWTVFKYILLSLLLHQPVVTSRLFLVPPANSPPPPKDSDIAEAHVKEPSFPWHGVFIEFLREEAFPSDSGRQIFWKMDTKEILPSLRHRLLLIILSRHFLSRNS